LGATRFIIGNFKKELLPKYSQAIKTWAQYRAGSLILDVVIRSNWVKPFPPVALTGRRMSHVNGHPRIHVIADNLRNRRNKYESKLSWVRT
jgi:hypothetical protein